MSELLAKVIEAREAWLKAVKLERETRFEFDDAADAFLRSFSSELEQDPVRMAHVLGDVTVLVEEEWFEKPHHERHSSLHFYETSIHGGMEKKDPHQSGNSE